jgi:hypothetical protein
MFAMIALERQRIGPAALGHETLGTAPAARGVDHLNLVGIEELFETESPAGAVLHRRIADQDDFDFVSRRGKIRRPQQIKTGQQQHQDDRDDFSFHRYQDKSTAKKRAGGKPGWLDDAGNIFFCTAGSPDHRIINWFVNIRCFKFHFPPRDGRPAGAEPHVIQ